MRIRYGSNYNERRTFEQSEVLQNKKGEKIMTKRFGFTLAEVLITLGIIGVVAAMTMPTLMNQTNGAQYKAAYKKALSAISQAVTLNVALDGGSFAEATALSNTTSTQASNSIAGILGSRMNVVKYNAGLGYDIAGASDNTTGNTALFFNDGSVFSFPKAAVTTGCTDSELGAHHCYGIIDVNGQKGPNKTVTCDNKAYNEKVDNCTVTNPTDIYPVVFYDQTILPATDAARAVLYGK